MEKGPRFIVPSDGLEKPMIEPASTQFCSGTQTGTKSDMVHLVGASFGSGNLYVFS